jgi:uncharacterized protein YbjQ (UPF0145 family)
MISPEAIVTVAAPDGFTVVRRLGTASAQASRSAGPLGSTLRLLGALLGVADFEMRSDAERARAQCLATLRDRADRLGANGIVNVRFEANEEGDGRTVVRAYGEAVVLEPEPHV